MSYQHYCAEPGCGLPCEEGDQYALDGVDFDGHPAEFLFLKLRCIAGHSYSLEVATMRIPCPDCDPMSLHPEGDPL